MIFIGIALIAIFLYFQNYKILALLLFFFFVTSGFNLVPEEITKFLFISKGSDFALLILFGILAIEGLFNRGYFNRDNFTKYLFLFASFLIICIFYSKFILRLGLGEILRTCRYQFFWVAYFVFRHTEKEILKMLLKCLFFVSLFTAFIFLLQIVVDKEILLEKGVGFFYLFGIKLTRFYNQPEMMFFFTFMALYHNPLKGTPKYLSIILFTMALLGAFHRSLVGCFLISIVVGYAIALPRLKRIYFVTISSVFLLFIVVFWGYKFIHSRTYSDIEAVVSGDVMNTEFEIEDMEATFTFRMLHLLERNQYLLENPVAMFLGAGLIPEDSKMVDKMFDFKVGLLEELTGAKVQLETSDISYSILILRLGYLGTFLYLLLLFYLMFFFYKKRENRYAFFSFLYLILAIGVSFFSANLLFPTTFLLPLISYHIVIKTDDETIQMKTDV